MCLHAETHLNERTPFGFSRHLDQVQLSFLWGAIALLRVARDAGAYDVFPSGGAATIPRHHVVEI